MLTSSRPRKSFRDAGERIFRQESDAQPGIISLLAARTPTAVRDIPLEKIVPNPAQPRMTWHEDTLAELGASIREHGVLQPILVRPLEDGEFQLIAGERRWRASRAAGLATIPALVEEIDDDTALEISIIENLQREDLSPLDEATMYDRMVRQHGYSVRRLAQKLGKDKGYLENRLRLADAPEEIRELVSLRKDTLSHAYELLKVDDPKKRKRLAGQVARGELTLIKLRDRIEGRPARSAPAVPIDDEDADVADTDDTTDVAEAAWTGKRRDVGDSLTEDSLVVAKQQLADAVVGFMDVLRAPDVVRGISAVDRANLAKYLTIAKLRLENAIAVVRSDSL